MVLGGERKRGLALGMEAEWREKGEELGERRVDMETLLVQEQESYTGLTI